MLYHTAFSTQHPAPSTQHPVPSTQHSALLVRVTGPLLV